MSAGEGRVVAGAGRSLPCGGRGSGRGRGGWRGDPRPTECGSGGEVEWGRNVVSGGEVEWGGNVVSGGEVEWGGNVVSGREVEWGGFAPPFGKEGRTGAPRRAGRGRGDPALRGSGATGRAGR